MSLKPAYPPVGGATASIEASRASAAVRTSVRREPGIAVTETEAGEVFAGDQSPLDKHTKDQSRPAVTGKETAESVPVRRHIARRSSAAPRAPPRRGFTRRRIPKSLIATAASVGRRSFATAHKDYPEDPDGDPVTRGCGYEMEGLRQ